MTLELVPLCEIEVVLAEPIIVGEGPSGLRLVYEVESAVVTGDRIQGSMRGHTTADWLTVVGAVGSIDVRATIETQDGAAIYAAYRGRTDISRGPGALPIYVAPLFETGDPRYAWLNNVQAVGRGTLDGNRLTYEWYEVR